MCVSSQADPIISIPSCTSACSVSVLCGESVRCLCDARLSCLYLSVKADQMSRCEFCVNAEINPLTLQQLIHTQAQIVLTHNDYLDFIFKINNILYIYITYYIII